MYAGSFQKVIQHISPHLKGLLERALFVRKKYEILQKDIDI
jgi:hypothetical protein